jgi:hypothetical protein
MTFALAIEGGADVRGGVAVVIGGAECVHRDYAALRALIPACDFMWHNDRLNYFVCNDMIAEFAQPIDHAVTLHPHKLRGWLRERRARHGLDVARAWCHRQNVVGFTGYATDWHGSSGLFAVKIAREELRHDRIILCGVPMTVQGGHFRRRQRWVACHGFRPAWERRLPELRPFVRSMSGWTLEILGAPDRAWLESR